MSKVGCAPDGVRYCRIALAHRGCIYATSRGEGGTCPCGAPVHKFLSCRWADHGGEAHIDQGLIEKKAAVCVVRVKPAVDLTYPMAL